MKTFLTAQEALELFDVLSNMSDVAHGHVEEGCYARAHVQCRYIEQLGYAANKAWLIEDRAKTMAPILPGVDTDKTANFTYHVAPSLPVEKLDGEIVDMVFDPSFFDGPAELDEWAFVMDKDPPYVAVKPFGEAPDGYKNDYKIIDKPMSTSPAADEHAQKLMAEHVQKLNNEGHLGARRAVFQSELGAALKSDALSSEFDRAHNSVLEIIAPPAHERIRPKRYWEIDPDELDAFYD